jgi:hypothetical protein
MLMPGRSDQHHAVSCEPTSLVIIQESGLPSKFYQTIENSVEPGIGYVKYHCAEVVFISCTGYSSNSRCNWCILPI